MKKRLVKSVNKKTARAYSSSANLGPGFDIFGLALDAFYDEITVTKIDKQNNSSSNNNRNNPSNITIKYEGATTTTLPTDPNSNTAGLVVKSMLNKHNINDDVEISIKKGVPTGLGLGSSAASAAAAAVACDALFGLKQTQTQLVMSAGQGEKASAGTIHYDNVAASVVGGFVIVRPSDQRISVIGFEPADNLRFCVAIPVIDVPDKKTKVSRGVLPKKITLKNTIQNMANASLLASCLATKNNTMFGCGITTDVIAEPARKHMIPGFDTVKKYALDAGAKEVMISGAGPSVIAIMVDADSKTKRKIADAMYKGFKSANVESQTKICKIARNAKIVSSKNGR